MTLVLSWEVSGSVIGHQISYAEGGYFSLLLISEDRYDPIKHLLGQLGYENTGHAWKWWHLDTWWLSNDTKRNPFPRCVAEIGRRCELTLIGHFKLVWSWEQSAALHRLLVLSRYVASQLMIDRNSMKGIQWDLHTVPVWWPGIDILK